MLKSIATGEPFANGAPVPTLASAHFRPFSASTKTKPLGCGAAKDKEGNDNVVVAVETTVAAASNTFRRQDKEVLSSNLSLSTLEAVGSIDDDSNDDDDEKGNNCEQVCRSGNCNSVWSALAWYESSSRANRSSSSINANCIKEAANIIFIINWRLDLFEMGVLMLRVVVLICLAFSNNDKAVDVQTTMLRQ